MNVTGTIPWPTPAELDLARIGEWLAERPVLLALAAVMLLAVPASRQLLRTLQQRRWGTGRQVTILPPPQVDPAGVGQLWATLAGVLSPPRWRRLIAGTPHVTLEYRWDGRHLSIHLWIPDGVAAGPVQAAVRAAWPGAACTVNAATPPVPAEAVTIGGWLAPTLPAVYPLQPEHAEDPLRPLIAGASGLRPGQYACVQVLARPATPRQHARLRLAATRLRTGHAHRSLLSELLDLATPGPTRRTAPAPRSSDPTRDRDARAGVDKASLPQWETAIRYVVAANNPRGRPARDLRRRLSGPAHAIASASAVYTARNQLRRHRLYRPAVVLAARRLHRGFLLSVAELAAIAALPLDLAVPGLDRARAKPSPAPVQVPAGGRHTKRLGTAQVGGHAVALPVADARQHLHVLGSTGSGKSTLLANLILDDVRAGRGTVVIDPKGDLVTDVLDRLPVDAADRVWLLDPDQDHTPVLNPLEGDDHDLVVDNIVGIFSRIFARHWGPRIDDVLRVACLTLLRHAGATLTLVPSLLQNKQFRAEFTADLDDPEGLAGFWDWYESMNPALRAQVIGPVLARLRAFLLRDFARRTLGRPRSSIDMRRILDGGLLLARLPKGVLGEDTCRLLGSFVLASVWQTATARASTPEPRRRDATIYLDEAQNFLTLPHSVDDMLAEARGYHLAMVLAHQNLAQLPRETAAAFSANARNKIYFSCAPEDARILARHTLPELDEHDLSHLDAYTAAARLVVASRETAAFSLRTAPPKPARGSADHIRRVCSQRLAADHTGTTALDQLATRSRRPRPTPAHHDRQHRQHPRPEPATGQDVPR